MIEKIDDKVINVYHTHIEIYPYKLGENPRIEKMLSVWIDAEYRYDPIGFYILNDTLYMPRGINLFILEKEFQTKPNMITSPDNYTIIHGMKMTVQPRDRIQEESIDFLTCKNKFKNATAYSQQALILDTGDGKTYTTVNSIIQLQMKAIIITHQEKIKKQWIETFESKSNVIPDDLININGSATIQKIMNDKINGNFYFINHQTLTSYQNQYGWNAVREFFKKISVGIKVYDEAHLAFRNVLCIDFFSNTKKTFYLTANFGRTDSNEDKLFKKCFNSVYKFGEATKNYEEKRKHIIYVPVLYRSNPSALQINSVLNAYGFSVLAFSDYALYGDYDQTMKRIFFNVFDIVSNLKGKILITVPKIKDTEYIIEIIKNEYKHLNKKIGTINSKNSKEDNEDAKENAEIICSTIKSCGTGVDIKGLRCIINLEPFSSNITANQLSGRLREYSKTEDTYFFDLIDISFKTCERQYKTKLSYLKKKCKEIRILKM